MNTIQKNTAKFDSTLKWLVPPMALLALVATVAGLWPGEGTPFTLTNFRGEVVTINARGLYYWDTVSSAAQMQANDLVMLILGVPLLMVALRMTLRGSLRGRLLLTGTVGFVLYTYITMCFGAAYNPLFLVYVALFGLSLYAFVLSMLGIDLAGLPAHFSPKLPRRGLLDCSSGSASSCCWPGWAASPQPGLGVSQRPWRM